MKAVILTIAGIQKYDDHKVALSTLDRQQRDGIHHNIQQVQLSDSGILVFIESYATLQVTGTVTMLWNQVVQTVSSGNQPNSELLYHQAIYFKGDGILGLRVVYTTNPLKRIVYDITSDGNIREAHV